MKLVTSVCFILAWDFSYSQVHRVDTPYERGVIRDGYKVGVWEYYDEPGELALKIDYNSASLLFLQKDTSEFVIWEGGEWVHSRLDVHPRFIGSLAEFYRSLSAVTYGKYPRVARINRTVGTFYILFEIDSLGKAGNFQVVNDIGDGCGDVVLEGLKKIPNFWLAAQKGASVYRARFLLPATFRIINRGRELKSRKNGQTQEIPMATILPGFVITALGSPR